MSKREVVETIDPKQANEAPEVERARRDVLDFYREELLSHATILLTLGLATFSAIIAWQGLERPLLSIPTITTIAALSIWQGSRLILYSRMTEYAMRAKPRYISKEAAELPIYKCDNALFVETHIYAIDRRVGDLIAETPGPNAGVTSRLHKWLYFLARPKWKGNPNNRWYGLREELVLLIYISLPIFGVAEYFHWSNLQPLAVLVFVGLATFWVSSIPRLARPGPEPKPQEEPKDKPPCPPVKKTHEKPE